MTYDICNLREWPFRTVADEDFASIWAGRIETKNQINRLLSRFRLFPKSGIHILWANFGMGKTHTLFHFKYLCQEQKNFPQIIPIYAVMPKRSTGFLELYREVVQGFPYEFLRKQLQKLGGDHKGSVSLHPMFQRSPGVVRALLSLDQEDIESTTTAKQWLAAQPGLSAKDLNRINVSYRIRTPEDALNSLSALTSLACYDKNKKNENMLLVMIDEYQRIGELTPRLRAENNSSLHTYFNQHPTMLQLILSFSCGKKDNVDLLLSNEIKSRAELQAINLDILSHVEATDFICDLLDQFRLEKDERSSFPFEPNALSMMISVIEGKKTLTPRRLMLYTDHILSQCLLDSPPDVNGYTFNQIQPFLNNVELGSLDMDEPE